MSSPYAPPKSVLEEEEPAPAAWRRTVPFLAVYFIVMLGLTIFMMRSVESFGRVSLLASGEGAVLCALFLVTVIRDVPRLRPKAPWWWRPLLYALFGVTWFALILGDSDGAFAGVIAITLILLGNLIIVAWLELQRGVRVYNRALGYQYVRSDEAS